MDHSTARKRKLVIKQAAEALPVVQEVVSNGTMLTAYKASNVVNTVRATVVNIPVVLPKPPEPLIPVDALYHQTFTPSTNSKDQNTSAKRIKQEPSDHYSDECEEENSHLRHLLNSAQNYGDCTNAISYEESTSPSTLVSGNVERLTEYETSGWSAVSTRRLIDLYADFKDEFDQKTSSKRHLWEIVAGKMHEDGFEVTAEQCHVKWRSINSYYRKWRRDTDSTGNPKRSAPDYFTRLEEVNGDKLQDDLAREAVAKSFSANGNVFGSEEEPVVTSVQCAQNGLNEASQSNLYSEAVFSHGQDGNAAEVDDTAKQEHLQVKNRHGPSTANARVETITQRLQSIPDSIGDSDQNDKGESTLTNSVIKLLDQIRTDHKDFFDRSERMEREKIDLLKRLVKCMEKGV